MRLVPVKYLKDNTEVAIDIINEEEKLLLKEGQVLKKSMVESLARKGIAHVYIRDEYCRNTDYKSYVNYISAELLEGIARLKQISCKMREGAAGAVEMQAAAEIVQRMVEALIRECGEDFKIAYEPNKFAVNSTTEQSIYVAAMSVVLGMKLGLSRERLVKLCMAALLKDMAIISAKIDMEEKEKNRKHPIAAYEYLKKQYNMDEEILEAVLQHEECYDGSGYPYRLKGEDISELARIILVIDKFYEVKTSHDMLGENQGMLAVKLKKIIAKVDPVIFRCFFKNSEIFSPDTMVRLTNGDIAVILENNYSDWFSPKVEVVKGDSPYVGKQLNLKEAEKLKIKNIEYYAE